MELTAYGWDDTLQKQFIASGRPGLHPARVLADYGSMLKLATPAHIQAEISGGLMHSSESADLPKVGDWVAVQTFETESAVIESVLPRRSEIARKAKGDKTLKQVLCANIDIAFVLQSLNDDFNVPRLERYLYQLNQHHVQPVIVLNKADQTDDVASYADQLSYLGVTIIICSALEGLGVPEILATIKPGQTAVLLGSSGVGKSTLTNQLLKSAVQKTASVREKDAKGRHTTSHRELFMLETGGMLIDTPGIRELQLWGMPEDLQETFEDVQELMTHCRYSNCKHESREQGCAVQAALKTGELDPKRYHSYQKMSAELTKLQTRINPQQNRHKKKSNHRAFELDD